MPTSSSALLVALATRFHDALDRLSHLRRDQRGQATAEYALVLLGAAAIALLLAAWAAKSGAISKLFDAVVDKLVGEVG